MSVLEWILTGLCAVAALWVIGLLIADRLPNDLLFGLLALIEAGLVVLLVWGSVRVFSVAAGQTSAVNYVGYLIGAVLLLPAAVLWSLSERNRGGTAVLLVGIALVPFMFFRLSEIWVG